MDKAVYNDSDEKIGSIDDLIITPNKSLSYAIIGVEDSSEWEHTT